MSAVPSGGASGGNAGRSALRRLVATEPDDFGTRVWGREPLLSTASELPSSFGDLFGAAAVDELVSHRGLRTPFLRVAKDGVTLGDRLFTAPAGVGAGIADQLSDDRLTALFADGSTLVLQALHRTWPPLVAFVQQLAADLGHPVQANAYVTPPQSRGFDDHYDVHDVFVLQVDGQKRWRIHRPVHPSPLRDQPWTDRRAAVEAEAATDPVIDEILSPGDCLYLPRGYLHAATALGEVSTHLTLGVHTFTRYAIAEELVASVLAELAQDEELRRSLPLGLDVLDPDAITTDLTLVRERLLESTAKVDGGGVTAALTRTWRTSGRAAPVGPLAQLRATQDLDSIGTLTLRDHLAPCLVQEPAGAALVTRAGRVQLEPDDVDPVHVLLAHGRVDVDTLGANLARRLLRAAVVVAR